MRVLSEHPQKSETNTHCFPLDLGGNLAAGKTIALSPEFQMALVLSPRLNCFYIFFVIGNEVGGCRRAGSVCSTYELSFLISWIQLSYLAFSFTSLVSFATSRVDTRHEMRWGSNLRSFFLRFKITSHSFLYSHLLYRTLRIALSTKVCVNQFQNLRNKHRA